MSAKLFPLLLGATLGAGGILLAAQNDGQDAKHASNHAGKAVNSKTAEKNQDEGERVFAEHCSRCHNAPQGFSPRISGTIVRHMRVRANLTAEEERALLHFFNP